MIKQSATATAATLALVALSAQAQAYQFEGHASYRDTDADSAFAVGAEFHFDAVNTVGVPLAEAGFMRHSNNVFAEYESVDKADLDVLRGGFELFNQGLYLAGTVSHSDNGVTSDDFGVRLGFLPADSLLVTLGYDRFDQADSGAGSVGMKWVNNLAGGNAFNLEGEVSVLDDDDNTVTVDAAADYYFTRTLSAGVRLSETDATGVDTEWGVGGRAFFTAAVSGIAEYRTQGDIDSILIGVLARF